MRAVTPGSRRRWIVVSLLVSLVSITGGLLVGALADDVDEGDGARAGATADAPSAGALLADRLGCEEGWFTSASAQGWQEIDVHDCTEPVTARIYGSLTGPQRDAAVRLLAIEAAEDDDPAWDPYTACNSLGNTGEGLHVVAGGGWVAVVRGEEEARRAARVLDGDLQPGAIESPAVTGVGDNCLP